MSSPPTLLPGRHALNMSMLLGNVGAMGMFMVNDTASMGLSMLGITTALSSAMGVTLTMAIGGKKNFLCLKDGRHSQKSYFLEVFVY